MREVRRERVMSGEKILARAAENESGGASSSDVGMLSSPSSQSEKSYVGSSMKLSRLVCKSIRLAGLFSRRCGGCSVLIAFS